MTSAIAATLIGYLAQLKARPTVRRWFRGLFFVHAVGVSATIALAIHAERGRWPDAYLLILPLYVAGLFTFVAVVIVTTMALLGAERA